ncbi:MAG: biotin--[acetyl-CoA-carboxylase] ligase, partial [Eubacteriales bacterium]|nr:biotin--[acetyl-CoA-carboxylase] ligase [Eubacteriales bacterium]
DEVDSTNTRAKALAAQGAPEGTLVIADCQREGRGRFGRRFHSPKGSGLYMSLVLRPRLPAEQAVRVTVIAAVAAAQAVEDMAGGSVEIKWVNDLFAGGKKLCGILTEAGMDFESGQLEYCVVGIGINVNKEAYPQEIAEIATSIQEQWGMPVSRCQLAAKIVNRIEEMMEEPMNEKIMEEYRRRSNVLGRLVTVSRGDQRFDALAMRIDDDGGLVVRTEDGDTTLRSGEVSLKVKP